MENVNQKPSLSVVVDVKAINYQNGNVVEATGKITKMTSGRVSVEDEDTLTFRASDCGKSQGEVDYNSSSNGTGEQTTNVDLQIKGRILNEKKELIDVIDASAKISKTESGVVGGPKAEDLLKLKIENSCDSKCATTESYYTHTISEATV